MLHLNLAVAQFQAARYSDAIEQSQKALDLNPELINARLFLGASHLKAGAPAEAIDPLVAVLAAKPGERNATLMLAEALLGAGRFGGAVSRFLEASKLLPSEPRVWYGLERSCEGVFGGALQELEAETAEPSYRDSLSADTLADAGRYAAAVERYKQALAGRPSAREVWRALSRVYLDSGHPDWSARAELNRSAIPASDCSAEPQICLFEDSDYAAAYRASPATGPRAMYWRAKACRELSAHAVERLTTLPESPQFHEIQARRLESRGLFADAVRHWQQASHMEPQNVEFKKGLALALYSGADFGRAVAVLKELIALDPASSELNYLCGQSLLFGEIPSEALPYLKRALDLAPDKYQTQAAIGRALLQLRRFSEAIPHLEAASKAQPNAQILFQLARAYQGGGQHTAAARMLNQYTLARASELDRQRAAETSSEIAPP